MLTEDIRYCLEHFLIEDQLITTLDIDKKTLSSWQEQSLFPLYAYSLSIEKNNLRSDYVQQITSINFYSYNCIEWAEKLKLVNGSAKMLKLHFFHDYRIGLRKIYNTGLIDPLPLPQKQQDCLVERQWFDFLSGKYGILTKDNKPEQIARYNATIRFIHYWVNKYSSSPIREQHEKEMLFLAVNELDNVCADKIFLEMNDNPRETHINQIKQQFFN